MTIKRAYSTVYWYPPPIITKLLKLVFKSDHNYTLHFQLGFHSDDSEIGSFVMWLFKIYK